MARHDRKKKRPHGLLVAFYLLMGVTVLLCGVVLALWFHGRSSMTGVVSAPSLPVTEETASTEALPPQSLTDELTIRYKGKSYRYKESMCNLLVIGVDGDEKPVRGEVLEEAVQSDVILLMAMDTKSGELTLINISRDTMCEIEVTDSEGRSGVARAQLALSYAYGDGLEQSCQLTRQAVSKLFYGLQIHGYGAYYMGGIAELNDAVGGVTVTIPTEEDFPFSHVPAGYNMAPGATVTLTGEQANMFLRWRLEDETGHTLRMARQKQYLNAFISQAGSKLMENPTYALSLYNAVMDYVVTDLSLDRISYLATQALKLRYSGDILSLQGENVLGDGMHMEFSPDPEALTELLLDVFYEEMA